MRATPDDSSLLPPRACRSARFPLIARFRPASASLQPRMRQSPGHSVLTLTAAPSSAPGTFTATVIAITLSSDPIGTTAPLALAISAP